MTDARAYLRREVDLLRRIAADAKLEGLCAEDRAVLERIIRRYGAVIKRLEKSTLIDVRNGDRDS